MSAMTSTGYRSLFEIPDDFAYLNCAYMGPLPRVAAEAGRRSYDQRQTPWEIGVQEQFFDAPEALRAEASGFFGATPDDIALVPAASYGLATAAANLRIEPGQEILTLAEQFPSNVYVWRRKAESEGGKVRAVTRSANQSWTEAVMEALGPQTAIVAIPEVHWSDGGRLDLPAISAELRQHGGQLVLDLTQSLGTAPFDLAAIQPDFAVAAGYKWLLTPYTVGFLYIAPAHQSGRPLEEGWIVREGAEDFAKLVDYADTHAPGARRFDMGERSAFQLVPAALESLKWLRSLGFEALRGELAERTAAAEEAARPLGLYSDTPDRAAHYLCLVLPDGTPADLAQRLQRHNVSVSQRGRRLRVTPHLYNSTQDIDRFAAALRAELA
ncbi:aminotransferase class V-fold PLP-dependent enzyme [Hyphobacterium sp.]|uniref:aminotransferase class V-fold PLP-dependent enzyme n=1 Tax=Hyphobacterium sp. TaxID=2004662 RepID=UPI003BAA6336